jgi:hypothetical protein
MAKTRKPAKKQSPTFKSITRSLDSLTDEELTDLDAILHGLIEAREEVAEAEAQAERDAKAEAKKAARGHIEFKMINGFGPYKYLRYWQGKTLKSVYIDDRGKKGKK